MTETSIRATVQTDIPALRAVVRATGLFPDEMLMEMRAPALSGESKALWLTCASAAAPIGFCFAEPEALTDGMWTLRALAVHPEHQRRGCGQALVHTACGLLRVHGQRGLIVDTSATEAFASARRFYHRIGFAEEARIRDFWAPGDDKITYLKPL